MAPPGKLEVNPDAFLQYSLAAVLGGLVENIAVSGLSVPFFLGFGSMAGALIVFIYYRKKGDGWMCSGMHLFAAAAFPIFSLGFGTITKSIEIFIK